MNLNPLLVEGVQADREVEMAIHRLASQLTAAKTASALRTARPANMLRRLLLAI